MLDAKTLDSLALTLTLCRARGVQVLEQNRVVELPPTYLHKSGFFLNLELRVQKG